MSSKARWNLSWRDAQARRRFVRSGRNDPRREDDVGTSNAAELATYVVEKGKPLLTVVK
jgi:hypothetical protein